MSEAAQLRPRPCPACGTPMREIASGKATEQAWVCNVMLAAIDRGLIGQPGRKHVKAVVYVWPKAA